MQSNVFKKEKKMIRVLMIDNEEKTLLLTKTYFSRVDIQIVPVRTILNAWTELEKGYLECIIIDIVIPNNDAYSFIEDVKKNKKFQYIPFVFLTAKGLTEDRIKGYKLGCHAYLSKPFDPEELQVIVENIILKKKKFLHPIIKNYLVLKEIRLKLNHKYRNSFSNEPKLTLSSQEKLILNQILIGKSSQYIASKLKISKRNVEKYITKILDKTQTKNTSELRALPWDLM
jgi:DNA-binding NarL/FixJ family response regulator